MESGYIEPTTASRMKLAIASVMGLALYVAMELWWQPFMDFVRGLPVCESLPWLRGIIIAFALCIWFAGLSALRAAVKTFRSVQSPFPGAWVWTRTKIKTGWRAKLDGYAFAFVAAICFAGPVISAYLLRLNLLFCFPEACGC